MPYLSEIVLNPLRSKCQYLLASPQRIHAAVEGSLPPERSSQGRVLWRLEREPRRTRLLVQTQDRPDFEHIVAQAGWRDNPNAAPRTADLSPLLHQVALGRQFGFKLSLNTVSSTRRTEALEHPTQSQLDRLKSGRAVRVAHRTARHQLDWFLERTTASEARWGFSVVPDAAGTPNVQIVARDFEKFRHKNHSISLQTAVFEGLLQVENVDVFREALLAGIGKGKAYGCGLLTLAPRG